MGSACMPMKKITPIEIPKDTFYTTRIEGIKNILKLQISMSSFLSFLNAIFMEDKYLEINDISKFNLLDPVYIQETASFIVQTSNTFLQKNTAIQESVLHYIIHAQPRETIIVIISSFNQFLQSDYYRNTSRETSNVSHNSHYSHSSSRVSSGRSASKSPFSNTPGLGESLASCQSLHSLIFVLEKIAASIFICTANKDDNFPIIYSNPFFTTLTGYSADDILGRSPNFLSAGKAETESIEEIESALNDGRQCQVALTNYRKDGMPFKNLSTFIPIFDDRGKYLYVVSLHFDVTKPGLRVMKQKLSNEFVKVIPKCLLSDDFSNKEDSLYIRP